MIWNTTAVRCLEEFPIRQLNGRHRNSVFIGDQPDARHCSSLVFGTVTAHHRTQQPTRFLGGYIRIHTDDGMKYFDRKRHTIAGQPAFLFVYSKEVHSLSRILDGIGKTVEQYRHGPFEDLVALNQLVEEHLKSSPRCYAFLTDGPCRTWLLDRLLQQLQELWLEGGRAVLEDFVDAANQSLRVHDRLAS